MDLALTRQFEWEDRIGPESRVLADELPRAYGILEGRKENWESRSKSRSTGAGPRTRIFDHERNKAVEKFRKIHGE